MTRRTPALALAALVGPLAAVAGAATVPVRIVTYNVDADTGTTTVDATAFATVLGGLDGYNPDGLARPVDLFAVQETTSNATTVQPLVTAINQMTGSSYVVPALQPGESRNNPTVGNGPSSVFYNPAALNLLAATTIGPASGATNGVYRQVARYEFQPAAAAGGTGAGAFYVYVLHSKSGTTAADQTARGQEATLVRADAATLPANSRVLYVGDLNSDSSAEPQMVNLAAAGAGQAFDPLGAPGNWDNNSALRSTLTESATALRYRDDFQLATANVLSDPTGLQLVPGSYAAFANNGSTAVGAATNLSTNTALPGLPNRANVLAALPAVTDHLPVIADYLDVVGPTVANWAAGGGGNWSTLANWSTAVVPDGPASAVTFGPVTTGPATVTLDGGRTAGRVTFGSANGYTLAGSTLTINDAGDPAGVAPTITVTAGAHTISAPLTLADGVTITTANGSSLTLATSVGGTGVVTVAGTVSFAASPTPATPLARSVPGLNVSSGTLTVAGAGSVLTTPTLSVTGGTLALNGNDLVVTAGSLPAVTNLIAAGRITATPATRRTLAAIANDDGTGRPLYGGAAAALGLFDGTSPPAGAVLVRDALLGDANLDGRVDGADYTRIDAGFAGGGTGWFDGDFNGDRVVDGSDYTLIDNGFDLQPGATPTAEVAAVPEPGVVGWLVLGGTGVAPMGVYSRRSTVRRRRRSARHGDVRG